MIKNVDYLRVPTLHEIYRSRTSKSGWNRETLAMWGIPWPPPRGWLKRLKQRARAQNQLSELNTLIRSQKTDSRSTVLEYSIASRPIKFMRLKRK